MLWLSVAKLKEKKKKRKKVHDHKTCQKLVATDAIKQNSFLKPVSFAPSAPCRAPVSTDNKTTDSVLLQLMWMFLTP